MDCNGCKYLNITESEQRKLEKGNHIPHVCTLYDKQVFHYGNKMMGYDPWIIYPCKECREHTEDTLETVARIADMPYYEVINRFDELLEELKNG